jgi:hypothetical protein
MINRNYTFPTKATGPANCIAPDSNYYGDDNFTWNFLIHWPVMSMDFVQSQLGVNLSAEAQLGSTEAAEFNLLKIARISRQYIMQRLPYNQIRDILEYRAAKDEELLKNILLFQLEILQTWGGYNSLYRITDKQNQQSIGRAAIDYVEGTTILIQYYNFTLDKELIRVDY